MSAALLVIDVQNALCYGESAAFRSEQLIGLINLLSASARAQAVPVLLVQHESKEGGLQRGTEGWELARGLVVHDGDLVIAKTSPDAFHHTALQATLAAHGVTRLVICGLHSEFCVDTTTRRALALGYAVTLVSDGHSTRDNSVLSAAQICAHHTATLANIRSFGPRVTPQVAAQVDFTA